MTIEIRDALPGDADAIADAHVDAWRTAYRGVFADAYLDDDGFDDSRRSRWRGRLIDGPPAGGDPLNRILVPVLDGQVVGFGHVGREYTGDDDDPSERGEIYGFYVHPDAWGTAAATDLIAVCHDELRERFAEAVLWVLDDNPRARRFYERSGWVCGRDDALVTTWWEAPPLPRVTDQPPVLEVQYRIDLRTPGDR